MRSSLVRTREGHAARTAVHTRPHVAGPLSVFRSRIPQLWAELQPLCAADDGALDNPAEADRLRAAIASRRSAATISAVRRPGDELEALLAGWDHFDRERRAVLRGTVLYLTQRNPQRGSAREEHLVDAAVTAILRRG